MREFSHGVFLHEINQKYFYCPRTLSHDVELKSSAENLTFQKGRFSRFANTTNKSFGFSMMVSAITEETTLYVFVNEP